MYLPLNLFINRSSYFEDIVVELYEIAKKKQEIYKQINSADDLKNLDEKSYGEMVEILNREYNLLNELLEANVTSAQDFGFLRIDETGKK